MLNIILFECATLTWILPDPATGGNKLDGLKRMWKGSVVGLNPPFGAQGSFSVYLSIVDVNICCVVSSIVHTVRRVIVHTVRLVGAELKNSVQRLGECEHTVQAFGAYSRFTEALLLIVQLLCTVRLLHGSNLKQIKEQVISVLNHDSKSPKIGAFPFISVREIGNSIPFHCVFRLDRNILWL